MAKDGFPEHGTALQKTKWARDQLRGVIPDGQLDAVTRRAYELEKAVRDGRRAAQAKKGGK